MPTIELLNHQKHKALRIVPENFTTINNQIGSTMIMPSEFLEAQREYPILFRKDPETGQFYASATFGFKENENLFLADDAWNSSYIPLTVRRGPFLIGLQEQTINQEVTKVPVIYFDKDDIRVSETKGERIFNENGDRSKHLNTISDVLMEINEGIEQSQSMINVFTELDLIEQLNLSVEFNDGQKITMPGVYGLRESSILNLTEKNLGTLNTAGFLNCAFCAANSLDNFKKLVAIKNNALD